MGSMSRALLLRRFSRVVRTHVFRSNTCATLDRLQRIQTETAPKEQTQKTSRFLIRLCSKSRSSSRLQSAYRYPNVNLRISFPIVSDVPIVQWTRSVAYSSIKNPVAFNYQYPERIAAPSIVILTNKLQNLQDHSIEDSENQTAIL